MYFGLLIVFFFKLSFRLWKTTIVFENEPFVLNFQKTKNDRFSYRIVFFKKRKTIVF